MSVQLFDFNGAEVPLKFWTFPGGERNVRIEGTLLNGYQRTIKCMFKSSDDIVDIILLVNAIRNINPVPYINLEIPYFPFARQDRVMVKGEPHALQAFAGVINMLDFGSIYCEDPHSDVLAGLFPPGKFKYATQAELFFNACPVNLTKCAIISPDAGALKKIYAVAKATELPVIEAFKVRDPATGAILTSYIDAYAEELKVYDTLIIVDDICDGGRTFIELAKVIKEMGFTGKLVLKVTHGLFSKGIECLDCFNQVYANNNFNDAVDLNAFNNRVANAVS